MARDVSQIQLALRSDEAGRPAAIQPALHRSGVARRDARLSNEFERQRAGRRDARRSRLARRRGRLESWRFDRRDQRSSNPLAATMPNGECWNLFKSQQAVQLALRDGRTIDIPAITLPDRSRPVHPTQLYSAIDGGILGWLLWSFFPLSSARRRSDRPAADDSPDHAVPVGDHPHR